LLIALSTFVLEARNNQATLRYIEGEIGMILPIQEAISIAGAQLARAKGSVAHPPD
jgi:hypothetical protein